MDIKEFTDELYHFLYYQNHNYKFDNHDVDLELAEQVLYTLTSALINNCVEFVFQEKGLLVYMDCYNCGAEPCNLERLDELMKGFKKAWRELRK